MNHLITTVKDAQLSYSDEPAVADNPPASAGILEFEPVAGGLRRTVPMWIAERWVRDNAASELATPPEAAGAGRHAPKPGAMLGTGHADMSTPNSWT